MVYLALTGFIAGYFPEATCYAVQPRNMKNKPCGTGYCHVVSMVRSVTTQITGVETTKWTWDMIK